MDKRLLSERDICSKYILPALVEAGWDLQTQIAEERTLTAGRIIVRGKLVARGQRKRADFVLYLKPNIPIWVSPPGRPKPRRSGPTCLTVSGRPRPAWREARRRR
jgi:hypothetical protein